MCQGISIANYRSGGKGEKSWNGCRAVEKSQASLSFDPCTQPNLDLACNLWEGDRKWLRSCLRQATTTCRSPWTIFSFKPPHSEFQIAAAILACLKHGYTWPPTKNLSLLILGSFYNESFPWHGQLHFFSQEEFLVFIPVRMPLLTTSSGDLARRWRGAWTPCPYVVLRLCKTDRFAKYTGFNFLSSSILGSWWHWHYYSQLKSSLARQTMQF